MITTDQMDINIKPNLKFYFSRKSLVSNNILEILAWEILRGNNFKDTHRENAQSNKTQVLTRSANMDIWVIGTFYQLFIRGSYT